MMWPGTLVLSSKAMPKGGTQLFALLALGGDIGCSMGPWATGLISDALSVSGLNQRLQMGVDEFSLKGGLLFSIVFPPRTLRVGRAGMIIAQAIVYFVSRRKNPSCFGEKCYNQEVPVCQNSGEDIPV